MFVSFAVGFPHFGQNFAVFDTLALQFEHCMMAIPFQNFFNRGPLASLGAVFFLFTDDLDLL